MIIQIIHHPFAYEVECVTRLFFPGEKIKVIKDGEDSGRDPMQLATMVEERGGGACRIVVEARLAGFRQSLSEELAAAPAQQRERRMGVLIYRLLSSYTGRRPPWGILTGVRPVRLCHTMLESGLTREEVHRTLTQDCLVTAPKAALALETAAHEAAVLARAKPKGYSLYISIPFCPSRCLYCSFVSHDIEKAAKLTGPYVENLCRELEHTARIAREAGLELQSIYMGGGTPTSLDAAGLEQILQTVDNHFDLESLLEYTVEAGRPDTITQEKLQVLRRHGVGRISINPQTMNDQVLDAIGRGHTAAAIWESYHMALEAGFDTINMDLIAGLPGESAESFRSTVEKVLEMEPGNITIHTLTVKRSSRLRSLEGAFDDGGEDLSALLDCSRQMLRERGYRPYYLYRQKGTVQNLENVGYSLPGQEGIYNVWIMEEVHTVLAVGAGGVTKLWLPPDRLQRVFNFKFPYEYLSRFDEMLARKALVKEFYESD